MSYNKIYFNKDPSLAPCLDAPLDLTDWFEFSYADGDGIDYSNMMVDLGTQSLIIKPVTRKRFKAEREVIVSNLTLDYVDPVTGGTWVFDADKDSIIYMATVISSLPDEGTNLWVLNNNDVVYPTKTQLIDIHRQMVMKVNSVWVQ